MASRLIRFQQKPRPVLWQLLARRVVETRECDLVAERERAVESPLDDMGNILSLRSWKRESSSIFPSRLGAIGMRWVLLVAGVTEECRGGCGGPVPRWQIARLAAEMRKLGNERDACRSRYIATQDFHAPSRA